MKVCQLFDDARHGVEKTVANMTSSYLAPDNSMPPPSFVLDAKPGVEKLLHFHAVIDHAFLVWKDFLDKSVVAKFLKSLFQFLPT